MIELVALCPDFRTLRVRKRQLALVLALTIPAASTIDRTVDRMLDLHDGVAAFDTFPPSALTGGSAWAPWDAELLHDSTQRLVGHVKKRSNLDQRAVFRPVQTTQQSLVARNDASVVSNLRHTPCMHIVPGLVNRLFACYSHKMISAADIRALRARLDETQETFGLRFGLPRFHVIYWEKYGIASEPRVEQDMQKLINVGNSQ